MFFIVHYDRAREQTHNKFARFYGHKLPCLQPSDSAIIEDLDRRTQNRMARGVPGDWETLGRVPISTAVDSLNGSRGLATGRRIDELSILGKYLEATGAKAIWGL